MSLFGNKGISDLQRIMQVGKNALSDMRGGKPSVPMTPTIQQVAEPEPEDDDQDDESDSIPEQEVFEVDENHPDGGTMVKVKAKKPITTNSPNAAPGSPGTLPQYAPAAKANPTAPQFKTATASQQSVYQKICAEWAKIADPVNGFEYFCETYVYINNQKHGYVHFRLYGYQKRLVKQIQGNRYVITRKFRQAGASLLTGVYCLWYSLTHPRMQSMIVSIGLRESSKYLQENVREIYEALPQWMKGGLQDNVYDITGTIMDPKKIKPIRWMRMKAPKDDATQMAFPNKSKIRSVPTGKAGGRGFTTKLLVVDEAAFIENVEKFYISVYPTINNAGGSVFVISTVNGVGGMGGWYYRTYKAAEAHENKFVIAEMHYTEHPDYNDPEWIADTRAQLGPRGWRQEVEGEFLASGNTYIDGEYIAEMEKRVVKPIRVEHGGKLWIWKDPEPGHHYSVGADCATMGGHDFSTFTVIDADTGEPVAEYRGKLQEDGFARIMAEVAYRYNTALVAPEVNATAGGKVTESLVNVQKYRRVYRGENGQPGWQTTMRTRNYLITQLESYLYEPKSWPIVSQRFVDELKTFIVTDSGKIEHDDGCHDDVIFSWMIGTANDVLKQAKKARPMAPERVLLVEEQTGDGIIVTTKPIYSSAEDMAAKKISREGLVAGAPYNAPYEKVKAMEEMSGEKDLLAWLLG